MDFLLLSCRPDYADHRAGQKFQETRIMMADTILIIDFGSQVTQLIARRLREIGVYTEILPCTTAPDNIAVAAPKGIVLSGGPNSVALADTPRAPQIVFDLGVPILGICYGQQTMCAQLGGRVEPGTSREFGRAELEIKEYSVLFDGVWSQHSHHTVWMSHGDHVAALPDGFRVVATSAGGETSLFRRSVRCKGRLLITNREVKHQFLAN